ncbi:NACHT domain-containing protein [Trichoderma gracile]
MADSTESFRPPTSTNDLYHRLSLAGQPSTRNVAARQPPTARSTKELEALQALQLSMIDEFSQNPSEAYAIEITPLASLVNVDDYVRLFDRFHNVISAAAVDGKIVDTELLRAFEAFLHCRQTGLAGRKLNLGSAMLSIQKALDTAVDAAHDQTKYNSIRSLAAVLDAMNEVKAEGIADVKVQSLLRRLEKLRDHKELRLAEAASYSYQALLAIPTDVSPWRKIGSSAVKTLMGGAKVAGSVWSVDPSKLVEGLVDLTELPELISSIIEVIKACGDLVGNTSGTGKAFKTLKKPKDWYVALRATDGLVWANAPKHLEALLRHPDLSCREVKDFLCGLCAQLEMARGLNHVQVCDVLQAFITAQASRTKSRRVLEWSRLVTRSPQLDSPNLPGYRRRKVYHSNVERARVTSQQPRRRLLDNAWRKCHKVREFYADQMLRDHYTDEDLKLLRIERLDGSKISLNECYINLAVVRTSGDNAPGAVSDTPSSSPFSILRRLDIWEPPKSERVDLEALFDRRNGASVGAAMDGSLQHIPMRILIRGQAGVGKTTLCKKMVHDFLYKGMWAEMIDRVIWVPLRQIKSSLESGQSISHILSGPLPNAEKAGEGTLGEALDRSFRDDPSRTLFILDGFDEVYRELFAPGNELLLKLINVPRVIITARPRGVNRDLCQDIHLELETIGFYPIQVKEYIEKHAGGNAAEIHSFIDRHPVVAGLARIPIQLDAICYSMMAGMLDGNSPPETMTELYHAIETSLWHKDVEMLEKRREGCDEPVLKHEAQSSYPDDVRRLCLAEINALQALSFTGLVNNVVEFDPVFLKSFHDVQSIVTSNLPAAKAQSWFTDLDKLSFLRTSDGPLTPTTRSYHFLHLTFQELFAAQFFVKHWMMKKDLLVFDCQDKDLAPVGPEAFLLREKYNPSYDVFWRFVSGTVQLQRDGGALCRFFQLMEEEPRDLLGPVHLRLTMHCLAEVNGSAYEPASFANIRQSVQTRMKGWLFLDPDISRRTVQRLVGEPEYPEELLREAAGMMGPDKTSLRASFIHGLSARPRVSPSLVDFVVEWSRQFIDDYSDDIYDEGPFNLSLATTSLLWHAPRSTPSTLALFSKLLDHPDRHIYQSAAATVWKVAENRTETEYSPVIVNGLVKCLRVRNGDTRVSVLSLLNTMLDLPASAFEHLQKLARQRPLWLRSYGHDITAPLYEQPEKLRKALIELAETAKVESISLSVADGIEEEETEAPLKDRAEIILDTLQHWKDEMYNSIYVAKLESIQDVVLQHLSRSEYRDDEFAALTLDKFMSNTLFDILGTKKNGLSGSHLEGLADFLASGGMHYHIFDMLFAYFRGQEDALAEVAAKLQRRRLDAPIVPPDAIFDSLAALLGGSGPLHRAIAAMIFHQHPRLPPCVWEMLLDNLDVWEGTVRDCALLFLATDWEHAELMDILMARFNVLNENGRIGAFPPELCELIRDIASQALTSSKANPSNIKNWAVNAVLKYPASGIMGLVVRLGENHLSAVYRLWLEEALEESLSWYVEGSRLCIRTSSGVVAECLGSEAAAIDFAGRLRDIRATMGIPS